MTDRASLPPGPESLAIATERQRIANERLEQTLGGTDTTPTIYIAGPFTAPTPDQIRDNIRRAAELGHEARKLGCYAFVPHLIGAPYVLAASCLDLPEVFGYGHWIRETLVWARKCDGMLMTSDWETSSGARGERDDARGRGQPVFLSLAQLKDWLGARR